MLSKIQTKDIYTTLIWFIKEALFDLSEYMTHNNRYWSAENPMLVQEVPIHDTLCCALFALSATRIIGPKLIVTPSLHTDMLHFTPFLGTSS